MTENTKPGWEMNGTLQSDNYRNEKIIEPPLAASGSGRAAQQG